MRYRTANFNWSFKLEQNWLVNEDVTGLEAKPTDFLLRDLHLLAGLRSVQVSKREILPAHFKQLVNNRINVDIDLIH